MPTDRLYDPQRLQTLRSLALLDSSAEQPFDRLTRLAARVLRAPATLLVLVDEDDHLLMSQCGLDEPWSGRGEPPLDHAFCLHAALGREILTIEDARTHALLQDSPAIRELGFLSCAGVPLIDSDGHVLGILCALDRRPRCWAAEDRETLDDLAASVMTELALRADIVLRRGVEMALQQSGERLRSILENAAIGIALVDLEGRPVEVNPALAAMLGYSEPELASRTFVEFTHPDDAELDLSLFMELVRDRRRHYRIEKRYVHKNGSIVWGRLAVSAIRDEEGQVQHLIGLVEDITEHKELERLQERLKVLEGLLPICMFCKRIRNEVERWEKLEEYITKRSEANFTHGCCEGCASEHFGIDLWEESEKGVRDG